ncbi:MAG TPA: glycosyltransferase family 2 protein [Candidatus Acidoferrales bacterium]|nr:glycosyltransferase family 2 protein [Candidatus Acidoferrales bacterium]
MPFLSIVAGSYNEEENVRELWERVSRVMADLLPGYTWELIVIDNASTDRTMEVLREICREDKRVKVILNNRNFGHIRSGYHAFLQARGDAVIAIASDLEDPPEMIPEFVRRWEQGYKIVLAQKTGGDEFPLFRLVRKVYYDLVTRLSDIPLVKDVTGFGLYDRRVVEDIRNIADPYPYFRGLICDLGYERALIPFHKPVRKRGITSNNFYTLYDLAMLGITNHSKVPLRLAVFAGCAVGALSLLVGFSYLIYKLLYWDRFQAGSAPIVLGIFFLGAVQLFFIGILGEYIGSIHTQVLRRPPVIEKERINFD